MRNNHKHKHKRIANMNIDINKYNLSNEYVESCLLDETYVLRSTDNGAEYFGTYSRIW